MRNTSLSILRCILYFFFTVIFTGSGKLFCQSIVKGKIIDRYSKESIAFAHIYQCNNFGIITNDSGHFQLENNNIKDSIEIIISALGYEELKIKSKDFFHQKEIVLSLIPKSYPLKEIVIFSSKSNFQDTVIGPQLNKKICNQTYLSSFPFQIGLAIKINQKAAVKYAEFYIDKGKFSDSKFRARIYNYDPEEDIVLNEITKSNLIGKLSKGKKGWAKIDLSPDSIMLNPGYVLVAFESVYQGNILFYSDKIKTQNIEKNYSLYGARILNCFDDNFKAEPVKTVIKDYTNNKWNLIGNDESYSSYPLIRLGLRINTE